jgi:hypothetical protein
VTEHIRGDLRVDDLREREGNTGVSEVVEAYVRQPGTGEIGPTVTYRSLASQSLLIGDLYLHATLDIQPNLEPWRRCRNRRRPILSRYR